MEIVHMAISGARKNQLEHSDLPQDYLAIIHILRVSDVTHQYNL